jgi:sporulation protein YlmC with PRC-barrel domain
MAGEPGSGAPCFRQVDERPIAGLNQPFKEIDMNALDLETRGGHPAGSGTQSRPGPGPGPALMGATTLVGDDVCTLEGDTLGKLKEIMLDVRSGRVAYAVVSSGGFLGLDSKLFAIPWRALRLDTVNKRLVLDVKKESLENAPGFDPDRWPDMEDPSWANQIHSYYGTTPYYDRAL